MSELHCTQCGKKLSPEDKFCAACGSPTGGGKGLPQAGKKDHLIIVGVLIAAAIIFIGVSLMGGNKQQAAEQPTGQMPPSDMSGAMGGGGTGQAPARTINKDAFLKNMPSDYESIVSMGNALMDQGHYDLAVECYSRALQQKPHEADIRVDMGACQHFLGQNETAIANFMQALEDNPAHQIAKLNLGVAYASLGDTTQAGRWWRKLLTENPPPEIKTKTETFLNQMK